MQAGDTSVQILPRTTCLEMALLPDNVMSATLEAIAQRIPSFILTSRLVIALPRRMLEWEGLAMITRTLHSRRKIEANEPIWAVKYEGLYYVAEGNHRSRVAQLCKQRRIAARLVRIPENRVLTPGLFYAISLIIGTRQPIPRQLSWVDSVSNVNRTLEEARRRVIERGENENTGESEKLLKLNRTTVGKILFGPNFNKLCKDTCLDSKKLSVDPLFNESEMGRLFWSGTVRLIRAGILDKMEALQKNNFKLLTKHLRLSFKLSKEKLEHALVQSCKDPTFDWTSLEVDGTVDKATRARDQEPTSVQRRNPLQETETRAERPQTNASRKKAKEGHGAHAVTRLTSLEVTGRRQVNARSRSVAEDATRGSHRPLEVESSSNAIGRGGKVRRLAEYKDVSGSPHHSAISEDEEPVTPKPPPSKARARTDTRTAVPQSKAAVEKPSARREKNVQTCAVLGCKMGPPSGMHECQSCRVDVHPYCCNKILGQPPQMDKEDPIYCGRCWNQAKRAVNTPKKFSSISGDAGVRTENPHSKSAASGPASQGRKAVENTQENQIALESERDCGEAEENGGIEKRRMEEDIEALSVVVRNLREVEGVRVLVGNHDDATKRDFGEFMTLIRRALRQIESIRIKIGED